MILYTLLAYWLMLWMVQILNFFVQQKKAKGEGQMEPEWVCPQ